jgi:serine/threonine protein kinase
MHFTEEEICNTFAPVIDCLNALHHNNIVHGALSPANIVVTHEDEIKLKDWLVDSKENIYYFNKNRPEMKKEDDWIALGQILLQAATLKKNSKVFLERELNGIVENLIDRYSRGFIFAICVLLKRNKERFPQLLGYLKNE